MNEDLPTLNVPKSLKFNSISKTTKLFKKELIEIKVKSPKANNFKKVNLPKKIKKLHSGSLNNLSTFSKYVNNNDDMHLNKSDLEKNKKIMFKLE